MIFLYVSAPPDLVHTLNHKDTLFCSMWVIFSGKIIFPEYVIASGWLFCRPLQNNVMEGVWYCIGWFFVKLTTTPTHIIGKKKGCLKHLNWFSNISSLSNKLPFWKDIMREMSFILVHFDVWNVSQNKVIHYLYVNCNIDLVRTFVHRMVQTL